MRIAMYKVNYYPIIMIYYAHWTMVLPLKKGCFTLDIGKSTIYFHDFPTLHENIWTYEN